MPGFKYTFSLSCLFILFTAIACNRQQPCNTCQGKGIVICDPCLGHGTLSCEWCEGKGFKKCVPCGGTGSKIEDDYRYVRQGGSIVYKNVTRRMPCSICARSGTVKCKECSGKGMNGCKRCFGKGTLPCSECMGKGKIERNWRSVR